MFDYQAGEKYKLTLIMVGLAGLMAGIFFCMLLMPTPAPQHAHRPRPAWADHPDVTGRVPDMPPAGPGAAGAAPMPMVAPPVNATDPTLAKTLIEEWLPLAWDLSAGTAKGSQEKAIAYMTPECASAYRQNIWTEELSKQIDEAGIKASFIATQVSAAPKADGSVVVFVVGEQQLGVPGKGVNGRPVRLEYLVRQTPEGLRIAGISESGQGT